MPSGSLLKRSTQIAKREGNTLLLMKTSDAFHLGQHEKIGSYSTLGKFGSFSPSGPTV